MLGVGTKYGSFFLFVYLSMQPSVCLLTCLPTSHFHHLPVIYFVALLQLSSPWSQSFPAVLHSDPLPPSSSLLMAGLSPPQDSCLPGWCSPGAVPFLSSHTQLRRALFCLSPTKRLLWKMDCQLFPIYVFLSRFSMYVIRCIQLIFTLCPFIIMLPPILRRKVSST